MDSHPTSFPGKKQPSKPKTTSKIIDTSKPTTKLTKEHQVSRKNRVFGTVRSTNILGKTVTEKPITKSSNGISQKNPKSAKTKNLGKSPTIEVSKNSSSEKPKPKLGAKGIETREKMVSVEEEPKTPLASPFIIKSKAIDTPYYSAKNCSKCRFDRLETASYWLDQIKLAESVAKHFVSLAFFRLAFDCNAQPIRNLQAELEQYLSRHGYLSTQMEWKGILFTYAILKDERNEQNGNLEEDQKEVNEQIIEQLEAN